MKMYVIDPQVGTVTMVDESADFENLYKLIGNECSMVEQIRGAIVGFDDVIYVDEEANILRPNLPTFYLPSGAHLRGKGIVMGINRGKERAPTVPLQELRAQCFFPNKMPGGEPTGDE